MTIIQSLGVLFSIMCFRSSIDISSDLTFLLFSHTTVVPSDSSQDAIILNDSSAVIISFHLDQICQHVNDLFESIQFLPLPPFLIQEA